MGRLGQAHAVRVLLGIYVRFCAADSRPKREPSATPVMRRRLGEGSTDPRAFAAGVAAGGALVVAAGSPDATRSGRFAH
jgi:hypothetical protein